jgi:predicted  nucleic acid-binding Zn-ribbon protein
VTTEDRTRFVVLMEDIQTQVKVIAEGHCVLVDRLDRLEPRVDQLESQFDQLEIHIAVLEKRVDAMDHRLVHVEHRVERIEKYLGLGEPPRRGSA